MTDRRNEGLNSGTGFGEDAGPWGSGILCAWGA
jgi:hypothetical protein